MKNLKNTIAAFGLMATLGFGAISANAGMLLSDRGTNNNQQLCGPTKDTLLSQFTGILIIGAPMLDGILIIGRDGILMSDKNNSGCTGKDGILVSDRNGILVSD